MAPPTAAVHVEMLLAFLGKPSVLVFDPIRPKNKPAKKRNKMNVVFTKQQTAKKRLAIECSHTYSCRKGCCCLVVSYARAKKRIKSP